MFLMRYPFTKKVYIKYDLINIFTYIVLNPDRGDQEII